MNKFNLTDKRIEKLRKLFEKGHTLTTAAIVLEVDKTTLSRKCKEIGLSPSEIYQSNLKSLQGELLHTIMHELEPDDKAKHLSKYLTNYQRDLDEPVEVAAVDVSISITADIMKELSGV